MGTIVVPRRWRGSRKLLNKSLDFFFVLDHQVACFPHPPHNSRKLVLDIRPRVPKAAKILEPYHSTADPPFNANPSDPSRDSPALRLNPSGANANDGIVFPKPDVSHATPPRTTLIGVA
jgi:hypothetical protein